MIERYGRATVVSIAATVLIWSTTFAALVAALDHFTPRHLLFLRWTLTAMLFVVYGVVTRMPLPRRTDLPMIALSGLLGFAAYQTLLVHGQMGVSATLSGFVINMSPVFTTVIAASLGRERARWTTWVGLAMCTAGLFVMAQGKGGFGGLGPSIALVALAALSFSCYTLVTKPLLAKYRPMEVTTYSLVAGALPFAVFAPGSMEALATAGTADLVTLVFLAVFPGGIAYALWTRSVKGLTPALASRFLYLIPVLGVPVAWLWVGETPHLVTVVGGLVTIAGVALASIRPLGRKPDLVGGATAHPAGPGTAAVEAA